MTRAVKAVKKGVIPAAQVFAEARKRPGYAEAYDALEEEFSLVTALIKARANSGLTQAELAQRMNTTVDVGMRMGFVLLDGTQHSVRSLRGSATIEIDERPAIHRPVQNGEVPADPLDIEYRTPCDL